MQTVTTAPGPETPEQTLSVFVSAAELADMLDTVTVVDTRSLEAYDDRHIPGAVALPLGPMVFDDTHHEAMTAIGEHVQRALGTCGVSPTDTAVVIDNADGTGCVAVLLMELAGLENVRMLSGGMPAWDQAGYETTTEINDRDPVEFSARMSSRLVALREDAQYAIHRDSIMLDVRSQLEHEGIIGAPCCPYRGNIPGSMHIEWSSLMTAAGAPRPTGEIVSELTETGINLDDDIIVYCHSGLRAAVAALILRDAGFSRVRTFLGSWHEWSLHNLPAG